MVKTIEEEWVRKRGEKRKGKRYPRHGKDMRIEGLL